MERNIYHLKKTNEVYVSLRRKSMVCNFYNKKRQKEKDEVERVNKQITRKEKIK